MKPTILSYIRRQGKISKFLVFLLCWTQLHAYSLNNFINNSNKVTPLLRVHYSDTANNRVHIFDNFKKGSQSQTSAINLSKGENKITLSNLISNHFFISDIKEGIIGTNADNPIDHVYDNIFIININEELNPNLSYYLEYDLYGLGTSSSVTKYINDSNTKGGENIIVNEEWSHQRETLLNTELVKGKNYITFTIPKDAKYYYKIRNVRITYDSNKQIVSYIPDKLNKTVEKYVNQNEDAEITSDYASLKIEKNTLKEKSRFTITSLRDIDLPALNNEIVNVTAQSSGFRFLPHGEHFSTPAKISIAYDKAKIPLGYTEQDIRTYYFDRDLKKWLVLEKDSIIEDKHILVSKTTHFTDMINGIIKIPESPETGNYSPNSIKDIKAANPTEGVVNIPPPTPNNMGTVTTNFPLKIPAGRAGMQPSLSVNYNSEGGNGWLGQGWDLSIPAISIDTRWGTPTYDNLYESETYTFNGEQLTFKNADGDYTMSHRISAFQTERSSITSSDVARFYPRVEGGYEKILRHGNAPNNYWWEVIGKDGTRNIYGYDLEKDSNENYTLKDAQGNIGYWALYKTIDANGNFIVYTYDKITYTENKPGQNGKELYLNSIEYTKSVKNTSLKLYKIEFKISGGRTDVRSDARLGFLKTESQLLNRINILYDNNVIRSYKFNYKPTDYKTLFKSVLADISEVYLDNGQEKTFYTHRFNYYEAPVAESSFDTKKEINAGGGSFNETEFKSEGEYRGNYSLIQGSKSTSFGGDFRLGFGIVKWIGDLIKLNVGTIGPHTGYNNTKTNIKTLLLDINGDGLNDRVYLTRDGKVYYSPGREEIKNTPNKNNCGFFSFDNSIQVLIENSNGESISLNSLGHSSDDSFNYGASWEAKWFTLGIDRQNGTTVNSEYFYDYNGDGLVDFVKNNKVYFNRIKNGIPTFIENSFDSPVPILSKECINSPDPQPIYSNDEINQIQKNNPLHDIVRVWVAPRDGIINVNNSFNLVNYGNCPEGVDCTKLDGVAVSFQKSDANPIVKNINAGDFLTYNLNSTGLTVQKGEKLYFRVSSKYNGDLDAVNWNPIITYTDNNTLIPTVDENGRSLLNYSAIDDFAITPENLFKANETETYTIDVAYKNINVLSDDVKLAIFIDGVEDTTSTITLISGQLYDDNYTKTITVDKDKTLELKVLSDSNIHWPDLFVKAKLSKLNSNGNSLDYVQDIQNVEYNYNNRIGTEYPRYQFLDSDLGKSIGLGHNIVGGYSGAPDNKNYKFTITAKSSGKLLAKRTFEVSKSSIKELTSQTRSIISTDIGEVVYLDVSTPEVDSGFKNFLLDKKYYLSAIYNYNPNDYFDNYGNQVVHLKTDFKNKPYSSNQYSETLGTLTISSPGVKILVPNYFDPDDHEYFMDNYHKTTFEITDLDGFSVLYNNVSGEPYTYTLPKGNYKYRLYVECLSNPDHYLYHEPYWGMISILDENKVLTSSKGNLSTPYFSNSSSVEDAQKALSKYDTDQRFGKLYRGWGAFSLNGNIDTNLRLANTGSVADMKIDISKLFIKQFNPTDWKNSNQEYNEAENDEKAPFEHPPFQTDENGDPIMDSNLDSYLNPYFIPVGSMALFLLKTDSDGDGVPDTDDSCPYEPGDISKGGCTIGSPFIGESYNYFRKWFSNNLNTNIDRNILNSSRKGINNISELEDMSNDLTEEANSNSCLYRTVLVKSPSFVTKSVSTSVKGSLSTVLKSPANGSFGVSKSLGAKSRTERSIMDFNGDGFPDDYIKDKISLSNAYGYRPGKTSNVLNNLSLATTATSDNIGLSTGGSFTHGATSRGSGIGVGAVGQELEKLAASEKGGARSLSVSGDYNNNKQNVTHNYLDINGDGLPDRYDNRKFEINLAKGKFDSSRDWNNNGTDFSNSSSESISAGLGLSIFKGSISGGVNYTQNKDKVEKDLIDLNNDGLPDIIEYATNNIYINTGNSFQYYGSTSSSIDLKNINKSTSFGGNARGTYPFFVGIVFFGFVVGIKITTSLGVSKGTTVGFTEATFKDMDGDGFVDMVTATDSNTGYVYKNQLSQTNLLKEVILASGGSWECEYKKSNNTYDSPNAKMVLSYCDVKNNANKSYGKLDQHFNVEYQNGFYSRFERRFYGFETVKTISSNDTSLEEKYYNNSYYKKGLIKEKTVYSKNFDKKISSEVTNYILRDRGTINAIKDLAIANNVDGIFVRDEDKFIYVKEDEKRRNSFSYFPTPSLVTKTIYEINGSSKSTKSEFISYDSYGNLTSFKDYGDQEIGNSEVLTSTLSYQTTDNASQYLSLPKIVSTTGTNVSREREAQYNSNGDLLKVKIRNNTDSVDAVYDFEYDDYGNIKKSTGPANTNNQRFYHEYVYDDKVATYPIQVKDAFGYSSKSTYDFKLGVPLYTEDMNFQPMKYKYDTFGRTTDIVGPYELFNNIAWTIHFTYPSTFTADKSYNEFYAITEHYNPDFSAEPIKTITISDGLGSPVQVKKSASIFDSSTKQEEQKFIVSGFVDEYKPGLPGWSYYPTIESIGASNTSFNTNYDTSVSPTVSNYDEFNRVISTTLPDGAKSQITYDFNSDYAGRKMLETTFTDELGKVKKTYTDIKGRITTVREPNSIGDITTSFTHDAVGNILEVRDTKGNLTKSTYDDFGRRTRLEHPDSGVSTYEYDLAGNLMSRKNAKNQTVTYDYDYNRLIAVNYPDFPENNVKYFYGKAKDQAAMDNNSVGRLTYQSDATGTQMFKYGKLGELVYNRRSVAVPGAGVYWFDTTWEYDTWNRVKSIIYSDGEKVTYTYNQGGNLKSMSSVKDGYTQNIIDNLGYDKFEQRVYLKYGNGTETTYDYEADRRRLANMKAQTSAAKGSRLFMDNAYVYDKVSNVKSIKNNAGVLTGLLGGGTEMTYNYDDLYRLTSASGTWNGYNTSNQIEKQRYDVAMSYDELHNITEKKQKHDKSLDNGATWIAITPTSYRLTYSYDKARPHAPKQIVDEPGTNAACCSTADPTVKFEQYSYDAVGNPTEINKKISDTQNVKLKTFIWDEENRLRFVDTNPSTPDVDGAAIYTYDAGGERIIKQVSHSSSVLLPEQMSTTATTSEYSIYPNGLINASISYSNNKFNLKYTKHYYAGSQRVSSKLGLGTNVGSFNCNWLITPFGSGATEINEKSTAKAKLEANTAASLAIMQANSITPPINYGQNAGYAENCVSSYAGNQEKDIYWYHPDHLGSSSFITGLDGEVTQSIDYFPSGEVFVENHKNSYNTPYKFNSKEQDSETGYYYYGARYYNPRVSLWLNVDPLAEKYPNVSPYVYAFNNPIKYIDPDGMDPVTALVEALSSFAISAGTDFLSNWLIGGDDINQAFKNISWGAATTDALITYGMSSLINGSGSATVYAKIAKSKAGKIGVNISKTLITNIISKYEKGEINELSDIDITKEFIEAIFTTLLDEQLGKKADELLELVKESDKKLYTRLAKLTRNLEAKKNSSRIEADKNAVKIAKKNLKEYSTKFIKESANKEIKKKAIIDGGKKIISDDNKKNKSK